MARNTFSKSDVLYRRIMRNTFFRQGWGSIDMFRNLQRLKRDMFDAEKFKEMVRMSENIKVDKISEVRSKHCAYSVLDGHFLSPLAKYYPGLLPKESEEARFEAIIPNKCSGGRIPMCVLLAGTGDHNFWRRRNLVAKPLVRENSVGSVMLVNPYYGCRKPKDQKGSNLNYVVDLFIMGCALMLETSVLLKWCEQEGCGPLSVSGVSMGGHMASLAATFFPKPLAVVPCLSWTTASPVFTEGVLSNAVAWSVLENQLDDDNFFEELQHICHLLEIDGVNARNSTVRNVKIARASDFSDDLLNSAITRLNTPIQTIDSRANVLPKNQLSENCESVSLAMLTGSFKDQLENNFKTRVFEEISLIKSKLSSSKEEKYKRARKFMKYILDITTHLAYFKEPVDPGLAVFVEALFDGYVPRGNCLSPVELWQGCHVKYIECGHVAAALYKHDIFRKTIIEMLNKMP